MRSLSNFIAQKMLLFNKVKYFFRNKKKIFECIMRNNVCVNFTFFTIQELGSHKMLNLFSEQFLPDLNINFFQNLRLLLKQFDFITRKYLRSWPFLSFM
jgi:hypothetical protein